MRGKIPELKRASERHFTERHRSLVGHLLRHSDESERHDEEIGGRIAEVFRPLLSDAPVKRRGAIPGANRTTIEEVVAAIAAGRSVYPDEHHLSSGAGIRPGNEASAGKRLRGRTTGKDRWLRRALTEAAWAAGRTQASDLGAPYRRRASRRGRKRAVVAVGHTLLVISDHLLKPDEEYQDLGTEHFDRMDPERLRRHLVKRLEPLGYQVALRAKDEAA
jgi:transposase